MFNYEYTITVQEKTRRLYTAATQPAPETIAIAATVLQQGGLVAFPTETVYGLGANALDSTAVERIFAAKQRPSSDPLIVHLADLDQLDQVVAPLSSSAARRIAALSAVLLPGPLTLILPRHPAVPLRVTAGRATVAVRVPAHPVAQALIRATGVPVAAPSANRFGHTSPTTADHVLADLAGRIDLVIDGGPTTVGVESTVVDISKIGSPTILRPGGVTHAELEAALGEAVEIRRQFLPEQPFSPSEAGIQAPGMLARHYAPNTELWLCLGATEPARAWLIEQARTAAVQGRSVGLLVCDEDVAFVERAGLPVDFERLGSIHDLPQIARTLYAAMRALDSRQPDLILARDVGSSGLALAITDRLMRAANGQLTYV